MDKFAEALGSFVKSLAPVPIKDLPINPDEIAKAGRLRVWMDEQRRPSKNFHPSYLADPCMRLDVIKHIILDDIHIDPDLIDVSLEPGEIDPSTFDYALHRKFDVGTALHDMEQQKYFAPAPYGLLGRWQCSNCHQEKGPRVTRPRPCSNTIVIRLGHDEKMRACHDHGKWIYQEARVNDKELGITGRVDLPISVPGLPGGIVIIDDKTVGEWRWKDVQDGPVQKDVIQLQIYLLTWPAELGILRYVHQGQADLPPKHYAVGRDERVENHVRRYIRTVRELAAEGRWKVAAMACGKETWARAKRCPLNEICFRR